MDEKASVPPRQYRVKNGGCIVREGVGLDTAEVATLDGGVVVSVVGEARWTRKNGDQRRSRLRMIDPVRGWTSEVRLEPYGTAWTVPSFGGENHRAARTMSEYKRLQEDATAAYQQWAAQRQITDMWALRNRVQYAQYLLEEKNAVEEAEARLRRALVEEPYDREVLQLLKKCDEKKAPPIIKNKEEEAAGEFKRKNWRSAAALYVSLAEEEEENMAKMAANASACYAKLKKWYEAERWARLAVETAPEWCKARRRLATALVARDSGFAAARHQLEIGLELTHDENERNEILIQIQSVDRAVSRFETQGMAQADEESAEVRIGEAVEEVEKSYRLLGDIDESTLRNAPEKVQNDAKIERRHWRRAETARLFMTPAQRTRLAGRRLAKRRMLFGDNVTTLTENDNLLATARADDWHLAEFEFQGSDLESSDISSGDLSSEDDEDILAIKDREEAERAFRLAKIHLEQLRVDSLFKELALITTPRASCLTIPPSEASAKVSKNRKMIKQINSSKSIIALGDTPIFSAHQEIQALECAFFHFSTLQAGRPGFGLVTRGYTGGGLLDPCSCWLALRPARHAFVKYALGKELAELKGLGDVTAGDCYGLCVQRDRKNNLSVDLFKNGDFICRAFSIAELYGLAPSFDESTPTRFKVYPAVAMLENIVECAEIRFGLDALNDPLRKAHLLPKRYTLVHEDGRPHPRRNQRRSPYAFVEVHTKGDGAPDPVWCQTFQARWTQSIACIHLLAIRKPLDVSASDCDVSISTHYLKAAHRATREVWLEGELERDIISTSSLWYVDDDGLLRFLLVKSNTALYKDRDGLEPRDAQWPRLFQFDDLLQPDDMDYDRTDMEPDFARRLALATKKASEKGAIEVAKREKCEALGLPWGWVMTNGNSSEADCHALQQGASSQQSAKKNRDVDIQPSYNLPGQIGYGVSIETDLVLRDAGKLTGP